ncbi:MAG: HAD family hydrolase [Myxococcota bacterium]
MIRAIVFDLFDTLVDQNHERLAPVEIEGRKVGATTPALHAYLREQSGLALSLGDFADRLGGVDGELRKETIDQGIELPTLDRFTALATHLECDEVLSVAAGLTEIHMGALREAATTPLHHEAVLTTLASEYKLGVCSNFTHAASARSVLAVDGLDQHMSSIVISEEIGIRKPRREIFEAVIDSLDVPAGEILHVGDSLSADVAGAAAMGMKTLWLTRQIRDPERDFAKYAGPRPDVSIEDLMDLPVTAARFSSIGRR